MHQEIQTFLQTRGLTDTEIKLYIQSLVSDVSTAAQLAQQSGIKRTTVYSALVSLEQKGLMSVVHSGEIKKYEATKPELIENQLAQEIDTLQTQKNGFSEVLPLFARMMTEHSTSTSVQQYTGERGVRTAIVQALFCADRSWKIIAPTKNYFSQTDKAYADYFIKTRKQRNIAAQSLWEPAFVKSRKFSHSTIDSRNPRILAKEYEGKFASTIILFDQKVLFINSIHDLSAVVISSPEIYSTMELFFAGVWNVSKPVPKNKLKK